MEEQLLDVRDRIARTDPNLYMTPYKYHGSYIYYPSSYISTNWSLNKILKKSLSILHPEIKNYLPWSEVEKCISQQQMVEVFDLAIEYYRLRAFE